MSSRNQRVANGCRSATSIHILQCSFAQAPETGRQKALIVLVVFHELLGLNRGHRTHRMTIFSKSTSSTAMINQEKRSLLLASVPRQSCSRQTLDLGAGRLSSKADPEAVMRDKRVKNSTLAPGTRHKNRSDGQEEAVSLITVA